MVSTIDEYVARKNYLSFDFTHNVPCDERKDLVINGKQCYLNINSTKIDDFMVNVTYTITFTESYLWTKDNVIKLFLMFPNNLQYFFELYQQNHENLSFNTTIRLEFFNHIINVALFYESNIGQIPLIKNMTQLYKDRNHSDLQLIVGNKNFKVHKSIVAMGSIVLAKMIESDMLEKEKGEITLHNQNATAFEQLLSFMYTNKLDVTKEPCELFKLAHYLDIPIIQDQCKNYLLLNIQKENIIDILELSSEIQYQLQDLKEAAKQFVLKNKEIVKIDKYKRFFLSNPDILLELFELEI